MPGYLRKLFICGILSASALLAQTSHRQPNSQPPRGPNDVFDQLGKQKTESLKEQAAQQAAARQQRSAKLVELARELPRLIKLAQRLQERLSASDLGTALPVDLEKQAKELEQIARRIHKQIHDL